MNRKQWKYRIVGAVVCLVVFCGSTVREADEKADNVQVPVGVDKAVIIEEKQSETITPQTEENVFLKEQTIHTQAQTKKEATCLPTGSVVRGFGWQEDNGAWRYHNGIDIAYAKGEQVRIIKSGIVERVEPCAGGYAVEVKSQDDLWRYEPLANVNARVGTRVKTGAVISTMREETALHIGRQQKGIWAEPINMQNQK